MLSSAFLCPLCDGLPAQGLGSTSAPAVPFPLMPSGAQILIPHSTAALQASC